MLFKDMTIGQLGFVGIISPETYLFRKISDTEMANMMTGGVRNVDPNVLDVFKVGGTLTTEEALSIFARHADMINGVE